MIDIAKDCFFQKYNEGLVSVGFTSVLKFWIL